MKNCLHASWKLCCCLCLAGCLAGCQVKRPKTVFSDTLMENILCDYHKAKAMGDELSYSDNYKKAMYIEGVFQKYGVTQEDFDSSMVWFSRHPDVMAKVYEQVKVRLTKERDGINRQIALRDNRPTESLPGDSVDVWVWRRVYALSGFPINNRLSFELPTDINFESRDTLVWTVRFTLSEMDSIAFPQMALQILYDKDTLVYGPEKVYHSGVHALSLQGDTLGNMKEIRGFIYYPQQHPDRTILLDSISLMRYHATDSIFKEVKGDVVENKSVSKPVVKSLHRADIEQIHVAQ